MNRINSDFLKKSFIIQGVFYLGNSEHLKKLPQDNISPIFSQRTCCRSDFSEGWRDILACGSGMVFKAHWKLPPRAQRINLTLIEPFQS